MRIITLNCNGLRSAASKGLLPWLEAQDADIVCLQETRAHADQRGKHGGFLLSGMEAWFEDSHRPGYSGVALYSRRRPDEVVRGIGVEAFDQEGRWLEARFDDLAVVSLYLPSGSSSEARQAFKFDSLKWLGDHLERLAGSGRRYIICGDINIAHRAVDLKNWRSNQKNSGFLPEERAWMDQWLAGPWRDAYRQLRPQGTDYTWWSNRGRAYDNDVGWRIDYQIVSAGLVDALRDVTIWRQPRFSDHAPLRVDYALPRLRRRAGGVAGERP